MPERHKDYFAFETIRDREQKIVCYYVTMIGTIEEDGIVHIRTDLGENHDQKMAFGRLSLYNQDHKIMTLLRELNCRDYRHERNDEGSRDIVSFTAKDWRADEVYALEEGDRVLVQGKAYIRANNEEKYPGRLPELSITCSGLFRLGRVRRERRPSLNAGLIPQK